MNTHILNKDISIATYGTFPEGTEVEIISETKELFGVRISSASFFIPKSSVTPL